MKYRKHSSLVSMLMMSATCLVEFLAEYFEDILLTCTEVESGERVGVDTPVSPSMGLQLLTASEGNWWDILAPHQAAQLVTTTRGLMQDSEESSEVQKTGG